MLINHTAVIVRLSRVKMSSLLAIISHWLPKMFESIKKSSESQQKNVAKVCSQSQSQRTRLSTRTVMKAIDRC